MLIHMPHFTWALMFAEGIALMGKKAIFNWKTGQGASSESKHLEQETRFYDGFLGGAGFSYKAD